MEIEENKINELQEKELSTLYTCLHKSELIQDFLNQNNHSNNYYSRNAMTSKFGFAIPCSDVVNEIKKRSTRILEIGAGTGYYSRLMAESGLSVKATDVFAHFKDKHSGEIKTRYFFKPGKWYPVIKMSADKAIKRFKDYDVFLSWPCYSEDWAYQAIKNMAPGQYLYYIGETNYGCCGNDRFFEYLDKQFEYIEDDVHQPSWGGIYDTFQIWRKK